jgi:hypothetical protein
MDTTKKSGVGHVAAPISLSGVSRLASNAINARIVQFYLRHLIRQYHLQTDLYGLRPGLLADRLLLKLVIKAATLNVH